METQLKPLWRVVKEKKRREEKPEIEKATGEKNTQKARRQPLHKKWGKDH